MQKGMTTDESGGVGRGDHGCLRQAPSKEERKGTFTWTLAKTLQKCGQSERNQQGKASRDRSHGAPSPPQTEALKKEDGASQKLVVCWSPGREGSHLLSVKKYF